MELYPINTMTYFDRAIVFMNTGGSLQFGKMKTRKPMKMKTDEVTC